MNASDRAGRPRESRRALGDFLKAKRATIAPNRFSLPVHRLRRVAGLRREEVAMLAGISVTWYTQIESAADITISPALLSRLADVFGLSPIERAYLFTLGIDEMGVINAVVPDLALLSGTRIAARTFEGEIALVLRAHRTIKTQIYSAIVHGTIDALRPHLDEARCPIGIWLHDDLAPAEKRCGHYNRASRVHAAFHREIEKVVGVALSGETRNLERLLIGPSRYVVASAILERAFLGWSNERAAA